MADIIKELNKITYGRRRKYFLWKNKIDTIPTKYSKMTEEEFKEFAGCKTKKSMIALERWEDSPEYKRLLYIICENNFDTDLLEVYNSIKEEAKKGNATAVKTMLELQKTIKNKLKKVDDDENKPKLNLNV